MTADEYRAAAARLIPLIDLTSLGDDDTAADIAQLCTRADTPLGPVASICTWPRFVATAVEALAGTNIPVCGVANFPSGQDGPDQAASEATAIVEAGGREVDVVVPWQRLVAGEEAPVAEMVAATRVAVGSEIVVKAILETGELVDEQLIIRAGHLALDGGADFLKTSSGKTARSATPEAVRLLAQVVVEREPDLGLRGVKVSGGVATTEQAITYLEIMDDAIGADQVSPTTVRFGASRLLSAILGDLGVDP